MDAFSGICCYNENVQTHSLPYSTNMEIQLTPGRQAFAASLARGEGRRVTSPDESRQLVDDVRRRGLERLERDKVRQA